MKHKKTTSKILLWVSLIAEVIMLIVIIYGWFQHLEYAYSFFFGVVALIIATIAVYSIKAGCENVSKGKTGANILPDVTTALSGIFQAISSGDIPSALSTLASTAQMIVANHPELSNQNNPMFGYIQPQNINSFVSNNAKDNIQTSSNASANNINNVNDNLSISDESKSDEQVQIDPLSLNIENTGKTNNL